jgi:ribonucleoside-diphosphate reductase alpha chain
MAFEWANEDSRTFLSRGYIDGNMTVEERVREIAKTAEKILDKEVLFLFSKRLDQLR